MSQRSKFFGGSNGRSTPVSEGTKTQSHGTCGICLDSVVNRGHIVCSHIFCFDCIVTWSQTTNTCPCCKRRFTKVIGRSHNRLPTRVVNVQNRDQTCEEDEEEDERVAAELLENDEDGEAREEDEEDGGATLDPLNGYDSDDGFIVDEEEVDFMDHTGDALDGADDEYLDDTDEEDEEEEEEEEEDSLEVEEHRCKKRSRGNTPTGGARGAGRDRDRGEGRAARRRLRRHPEHRDSLSLLSPNVEATPVARPYRPAPGRAERVRPSSSASSRAHMSSAVRPSPGATAASHPSHPSTIDLTDTPQSLSSAPVSESARRSRKTQRRPDHAQHPREEPRGGPDKVPRAAHFTDFAYHAHAHRAAAKSAQPKLKTGQDQTGDQKGESEERVVLVDWLDGGGKFFCTLVRDNTGSLAAVSIEKPKRFASAFAVDLETEVTDLDHAWVDWHDGKGELYCRLLNMEGQLAASVLSGREEGQFIVDQHCTVSPFTASQEPAQLSSAASESKSSGTKASTQSAASSSVRSCPSLCSGESFGGVLGSQRMRADSRGGWEENIPLPPAATTTSGTRTGRLMKGSRPERREGRGTEDLPHCTSFVDTGLDSSVSHKGSSHGRHQSRRPRHQRERPPREKEEEVMVEEEAQERSRGRSKGLNERKRDMTAPRLSRPLKFVADSQGWITNTRIANYGSSLTSFPSSSSCSRGGKDRQVSRAPEFERPGPAGDEWGLAKFSYHGAKAKRHSTQNPYDPCQN